MKKFIFTESIPAIKMWTYTVEAENEEEALGKIMNGDIEADEYNVISDGEEDEVEYQLVSVIGE